VREHHAFGLACRARGVDDGEAIFRFDALRTRVELAGMLFHPNQTSLAQARQRHGRKDRTGLKLVLARHRKAVFVDHDDARRRLLFKERPQLRCLLRVLGDNGAGPAIIENEATWLGRRGRIDGNRNQTGQADGDVAQNPLQPRLGQNADAVATPEAKRKQARGEFPCRLIRLRPGQPVPDAIHAEAKRDAVRELAHPRAPNAVRAVATLSSFAVLADRHEEVIVIAAPA
jgi:hypothetical protein